MRKGLGLNRGRGYFNILMADSRVHSLSAKGISQPQQLAYSGTYSRKIINPEMGIEELKALPLGNVYYDRKRVAFMFGDKHINYKIKFNRKVGNIANWGHSLRDNRLFIDNDVPEKYKPQLAVHEAIEQYVSENYGFRYPEAHNIAEHFERKYADSHNIDWETSQKAIFNTKI
jgi:hypothetical protein